MDGFIDSYIVDTVSGTTVADLEDAVSEADGILEAAKGALEDAQELLSGYEVSVTAGDVTAKQTEVDDAKLAWDNAQTALDNLPARSVADDGESMVEVISLDEAQRAIHEGSVIVTADATDVAGNVSPTASTSFTLDLTEPSDLSGMDLVNDTGINLAGDDDLTNDPAVTTTLVDRATTPTGSPRNRPRPTTL